jgi:hypothetical protein
MALILQRLAEVDHHEVHARGLHARREGLPDRLVEA